MNIEEDRFVADLTRLIRSLALFAFLCFLWAIAGTFVDEREAEEPPVRVDLAADLDGLQCRADDFELQLRAVEDAIAAQELARALFPEVDP